MKKYTYISLFSSAGVGCYGFKKEKFECIATNELLEKRLKIQEYNNKCKYKTGYISGDIEKLETKKRIFLEVDKWKRLEKIKEVDVLIATPPCQGMSVANHKKKNETARNSLIIQSILLTLEILPRYFVFENVRAFLNTLCRTPDGRDISINDFIDEQLSTRYNVLKRVINFKDYGSNSSRTRTLVVGVRKDIKDITPFDIFPSRIPEKTLKDVIGKMQPLETMGEVDAKDIYHSFRKYDKRMLPWVINTPEGKSAFGNRKIEHRPHTIVDGQLVENTNKNGDKYTRCSWNKGAPCIHTRNDILASQSTVHPRDNRVFSVRELMKMMTIPDTFRWCEFSLKELNGLSAKEKEAFIKKEDMNIRQSIGEAVPTAIFEQIAKKIKEKEVFFDIAINAHKFLNSNGFSSLKNIKDALTLGKNLPYAGYAKAIELLNTNKTSNAAYYTPANVCYDVVKELPEVNKDVVYILEPSVGAGNFIPLILERYANKQIVIDIIDIDNEILQLTSTLIQKFLSQFNIKINIINEDFLMYTPKRKYDVVVGNPPFGKVTDAQLLTAYRKRAHNKKTGNLFSFFMEKALSISDFVSLIVPKSLLNAPEYNATRAFIEDSCRIKSVLDFGEDGFSGVKIETIALSCFSQKTKKNYDIKVESMITKSVNFLSNSLVFDKELSSWLIYKDDFFEAVKESLYLGIFSSFRDRQITKKHTINKGKYRVLKSRNIGTNEIIDIEGYDTYMNEICDFNVKKFINTKSVLAPNLTYNPRACFLPPNCITDGSVAILQAKNGYFITEKDLEYFASDEFRRFYMIGRNLGTRSLNIDSNSVNLWGIKKGEHRSEHK